MIISLVRGNQDITLRKRVLVIINFIIIIVIIENAEALSTE